MLIDIRNLNFETRNVPETPNTEIIERLFSLIMFKIEVEATFLDVKSGVNGSVRSKNSRLGHLSLVDGRMRDARLLVIFE